MRVRPIGRQGRVRLGLASFGAVLAALGLWWALPSPSGGSGGDPGREPGPGVEVRPAGVDGPTRVPDYGPVEKFDFPGVEGEISTYSALLENAALRKEVPPARIRIPQLGVDAEVVDTGVDSGDYTLEVPPTGEVVAWYRHGPSPGDPGSSVLAGHVDYNGQRGVFFELRLLEPGATFEVEDEEGTTRSFRVVDRRQVPKEDLPKANVLKTGGPPTLVLVTCGGQFDDLVDSYRDNILIDAVPA